MPAADTKKLPGEPGGTLGGRLNLRDIVTKRGLAATNAMELCNYAKLISG
jgi:hypothetical protein